MISLFSIKCEILQLLLIFTIIENSLRKYNIFVDLIIKIVQCGPLSGIDLHHIKHNAVLHPLLGIIKISHLHSLKKFAFFLFEIFDLFFSVHGNVANSSSPPIKVSSLLSHTFLLEFLKIGILNLSLSFPVLLKMLLPKNFHLSSISLLFLIVDSIFLSSDYCAVTEGLCGFKEGTHNHALRRK
jgi:hypothetical protein